MLAVGAGQDSSFYEMFFSLTTFTYTHARMFLATVTHLCSKLDDPLRFWSHPWWFLTTDTHFVQESVIRGGFEVTRWLGCLSSLIGVSCGTWYSRHALQLTGQSVLPKAANLSALSFPKFPGCPFTQNHQGTKLQSAIYTYNVNVMYNAIWSGGVQSAVFNCGVVGGRGGGL